MNKRAFKFVFLTGIILNIFLITTVAVAQYYDEGGTRFFDNFVININGGPTLFFGDVQTSPPFQEDWKLGFGVIFRKQFSPLFSVGIQTLSAKLHGSVLNWPDGSAANLFFDASLIEFNLHTTINLSNAIFGYNPERTIGVYGIAGVGITNWTSTLVNSLNNDILNQNGFGPDGKNVWTPEIVFPVGIGLNINLSSNIGLNLESVYHIINSDNLDAKTTTEANNDKFLYTSVGLSFSLSGFNKTFTRSGGGANNYDRDLAKQQKYQEKMANKERKKQLRDEQEQDRRNQIDQRKNRGRNKIGNDFPVAAEYDLKYSFREQKVVSTKPKITEETIADLPPGEIVIIDDGKHFITGVKPAGTSTFGETNTNTKLGSTLANIDENTLSSDIIRIPETGTMYTVQIMASQKPMTNIPDLRRKYFIGKQIFISQKNNMYRYSAGYFRTYEDAVIYSKQLKENGLTDAFVAIYQNGSRILYRPK